MEENPTTSLREARIMEKTSRQLPSEIIIEILSRLPAKSLLRFRCVCKSWYNFISHPDFIDMHLKFNQNVANNKGCLLVHHRATGRSGDDKQFSLHSDDETFVQLMKLELPFTTSSNQFRVEGYCNGLVCLSSHVTRRFMRDNIYLWNPSIHKFKALPKLSFPFGYADGNAFMSVSFGFVPLINDYKVIRIVDINGVFFEFPPKAEIYSLKLNSWKEIQNTVPCMIEFNSIDPIVNGFVHWMAGYGDFGISFNDGFILTFDMANEVFGQMNLPECCRDKYNSVTVLKELLSLFSYRERNKGPVDIWVMKEYGAAESWTKLFTFDQRDQRVRLNPLGFLKNGEVVLTREYYGDELVSYDPTINQVKYLQTCGITKPLHAFTYYRESLVLLNEEN